MFWPKVKDLSILQVLDKKGFLFIHTAVQVASSLKPLSQTLCGSLDLISGINNLFEIHALISLFFLRNKNHSILFLYIVVIVCVSLTSNAVISKGLQIGLCQ